VYELRLGESRVFFSFISSENVLCTVPCLLFMYGGLLQVKFRHGGIPKGPELGQIAVIQVFNSE
jgi:hypothetical protein